MEFVVEHFPEIGCMALMLVVATAVVIKAAKGTDRFDDDTSV